MKHEFNEKEIIEIENIIKKETVKKINIFNSETNEKIKIDPNYNINFKIKNDFKEENENRINYSYKPRKSLETIKTGKFLNVNYGKNYDNEKKFKVSMFSDIYDDIAEEICYTLLANEYAILLYEKYKNLDEVFGKKIKTLGYHLSFLGCKNKKLNSFLIMPLDIKIGISYIGIDDTLNETPCNIYVKKTLGNNKIIYTDYFFSEVERYKKLLKLRNKIILNYKKKNINLNSYMSISTLAANIIMSHGKEKTKLMLDYMKSNKSEIEKPFPNIVIDDGKISYSYFPINENIGINYKNNIMLYNDFEKTIPIIMINKCINGNITDLIECSILENIKMTEYDPVTKEIILKNQYMNALEFEKLYNEKFLN